jgi:hypothetical protein
MEAKHKRMNIIIRKLGGTCLICGLTEPLVIHHLSYKKTPTTSLKALKQDTIVLLCRKHHRPIHYINEIKRAGYLDPILKLLNEENQPYK